jgi:uncharacterized protein
VALNANFASDKTNIMSQTKNFPTPPWDMDTAAARLQLEEAAWNSHDISQILAGYADNPDIRDGLTFIHTKDQLSAFLTSKLSEQQDYHVSLDLWGALKGRMAVRFEATWRTNGQQYKSYGVQVFQFNDEGLVERRFTSQEVMNIEEK